MNGFIQLARWMDLAAIGGADSDREPRGFKVQALKNQIQREIAVVGYAYAERALARHDFPRAGSLLTNQAMRDDLENEIRDRWNANSAILAYDEDELQDAVRVAAAVAIAAWDRAARADREIGTEVRPFRLSSTSPARTS
jgi:hypothetical protein